MAMSCSAPDRASSASTNPLAAFTQDGKGAVQVYGSASSDLIDQQERHIPRCDQGLRSGRSQ